MITQRLPMFFDDPNKRLDFAPVGMGIDIAPDHQWTAHSLSVNDVPIQSFSDLVTGGNPFITVQPEFGPGLVGAGDGLRALDFNGTDQWLQGTPLPITQGSIVIVCRVDPSYVPGGAVQPLIMFNHQEKSTSTDDGLIWYAPGDGTVRLDPVGTDEGPIVTNRSYSPGEWLVICYSNPTDGGPVRFMVNGEANTADLTRSFYGYNRAYLAHGGTPARRLHGQIALLATWNEHLTNVQMSTVTRTLKARFPSALGNVGPIWPDVPAGT